MKYVKTTLVYGFIGAGKTTYIQDLIYHSSFHKRGTTLILCFEEGETDYNEKELAGYRTSVAFYESGESITAFCRRILLKSDADRVFVEMNGMLTSLRDRFPEEMNVTLSTMIIDTTTCQLYLTNLRQHLQNMIIACDIITFNRCENRRELAGYGRIFRLMNRNAKFIRKGPDGHYEKAFDDLMPLNTEQDDIEISQADYITFFLAALIHPEQFDGKTVNLFGQIRGEQIGRTVMTCCPADLQFLGIPYKDAENLDNSWVNMKARGETVTEGNCQKKLLFKVLTYEQLSPPENPILTVTD